MTKRDVERWLESNTASTTLGRLCGVLNRCATVAEFRDLTEAQLLQKFREDHPETKYDLGPATYVALGRAQDFVRTSEYEEKRRDRREAEEARQVSFTRDELLQVAAFMESMRIAKVDMAAIRKLVDACERDPSR